MVFSNRGPLGKIVTVLLSGDQEVVQVKMGENERELLTEVLFMGTLNETVIQVLSGTSGSLGDFDETTGRRNVVKFQG